MYALENLLLNLRYSARQLWKTPGFSIIAVFTLALGIGANTAIFSVVDMLLFRPLPVTKPDELARIGISQSKRGPAWYFASFPNYLQYRDYLSSFSGMAAWADRFPANVSVGKLDSERVDSGMVTGNYFPLLGTRAEWGRTLTEQDDLPGAQPTVMLSHNFARRHFSDPKTALDSQVLVDGQWFTAIGITPASFGGVDFNNFPEIWLPMTFAFQIDPLLRSEIPQQKEAFIPFGVVGRLKPGVSLSQAEAELEALAVRLGAGKPDASEGDGWTRPWPVLSSATDAARQGERSYVSFLLLGAVLLVLLIACADLAGLLLVRSEVRQKEIAVRLALGGSRWQIISLQLGEALLIAIPGAVLGCALAAGGTHLLLISSPSDLPLPLERATSVLDFRVLLFTALASLLAAIISTLGPALRYSRLDPMPAMKNDARNVTASSRRPSIQAGLVVLQVAASVLLLTGAGLLTRTLWHASQIQLGFDPDHAVGASTDLIRQGYDKNAAQNLLDPLLNSLRAQPGVKSAALGALPMTGTMSTGVNVEGHEKEKIAGINLIMISPGYLQTLGIPLKQGRDFTPSDGRNAPAVTIINEAMARKYWPHESPLGKHIENVGPKNQTFEITGVAGDVAQRDLRREPRPLVYFPLAQSYLMFPWQPDVTLLAQSAGDPAPLFGSIRAAVANVDPRLPVFHMRTLREQAGIALARIIHEFEDKRSLLCYKHVD
jgi:putative ABC transport system permease protein